LTSASTWGIEQSGDSYCYGYPSYHRYFVMAYDSNGSGAAWVQARVNDISHYHNYQKNLYNWTGPVV